MRVPLGSACCTGVSRATARWARRLLSPRRLTALLLAFVIGFTPLSPLMLVAPLAPVTPAQADVVDQLDQCLGILGAGTDAAASVAHAVANPDFIACTAEAAQGNPAVIASMAIMTAIFAAQTAAGHGKMPFTNTNSCIQSFETDFLQLVVSGIEGLMGGLLKDLMTSLIYPKGMCLMELIAGSQLDDGCAALGVTAGDASAGQPAATDPSDPASLI